VLDGEMDVTFSLKRSSMSSVREGFVMNFTYPQRHHACGLEPPGRSQLFVHSSIPRWTDWGRFFLTTGVIRN